MCDYSLELYRSRSAEKDEMLTTHRFPSGTIGFIKDDKETAVCVLPGACMTLSGINENTQKAYGVGPVEEVVFHKNDSTGYAHRDSVIFKSNGKEILLQLLHADIRALHQGPPPVLETTAAVETPDLIDAD